MPTDPKIDLNADAPLRVWDAVKIEKIEQRLNDAGVKLPSSPDAPEMDEVSAALQAADPELFAELQECVAPGLRADTVSKLGGPADRAAKSQALKGMPGRLMSSPNHKNRLQVDGVKFAWIVGSFLLFGGIGFVMFNPSGQAASTGTNGQGVRTVASSGAGTAGAAGQVAGAPAAGSPGNSGVQAGGTTAPGTTGAPGGPAAVAGGVPPLPTPVQGGQAGTDVPAAITTAAPPSVAAAPVSAAPAPTPYIPAAVSAPPSYQQPAPASVRSQQTVPAASSQNPARVPLMALQPPARIEPPRRIVALRAPLQRDNRVVQSSPAAQQGAGVVDVARAGVMVSSTQVAGSRLSSSAPQAPAPVTSGLVSQGQANAPQTALGQGMSQQSAPSAGRSGLVAMGSQTDAASPPSQGLVSASGGAGGTALGNSAADSSGGRGGLVSLASASSSPSMSSQGQGATADTAPASSPAPQAATVLGGAAPAPAVPDSPYMMGKQIKAVTDTGALFASVVGSDNSGVINGEDAQLVYATAEDGSVWRGAPRLLTSGRIGLTFDRVLVKGQTMKVTADATDSTGLPGVQAESHTDSPKIASELFQSLLSGARSFAQASLQGDTSITANGTIVSASAKPNFWVTLGGALAGSLSLPSTRVTQVNVTSLPKGTQILLVVRGGE